MIRKVQLSDDVVSLAKHRIKNIFNSANKICMSISGGKDSVCLNDLVYKMCSSGEVDKRKLQVTFIDEEAIYPCVEQVVFNMRKNWLSIGVKFEWFCIQVKHFNCLNQLTNDESFICWDENKKDVWIRQKPEFAISNHPLLKPRIDTYQQFCQRKDRDKVTITGVRATESVQRLKALAISNNSERLHPIYDWTDTDVWKYIRENNLDIPKAYEYMFRVGIPLNRMRISQFFSIDTMPSLVQMCEFYPDLFDKICKREPNAYMAALYYDTELYRRKKKQKHEEEKDYKQLFLKALKEEWRYQTKSSRKTFNQMQHLAIRFSPIIDNSNYKQMYQALIGGDPKDRVLRSVMNSIFRKVNNK